MHKKLDAKIKRAKIKKQLTKWFSHCQGDSHGTIRYTSLLTQHLSSYFSAETFWEALKFGWGDVSCTNTVTMNINLLFQYMYSAAIMLNPY